MRDSINLVIEVFEKATLIIIFETIQSKWRIKYNTGVLSDWKDSSTSSLLNSGYYEIEFKEVIGYNKPDNYICFLKAGQIKKINVVYTKKKTSDLQISFLISKYYQKYLSWKLIQLQGQIIKDWNHDINYKENLPNGKYQLQITEYLSNIIFRNENDKLYDYLTGLEVGDYRFYICGESYNFDLVDNLLINREYINSPIIPLPPVLKYVDFNCIISPEEAREFIQWRLVSPLINSEVWLNSGETINIACGSYYLQILTNNEWITDEYDSFIKVEENTNVIIFGVKDEQPVPSDLTSTISCTINPEKARNFIQWRLVSNSLITPWMENKESIEVIHDIYYIQTLTESGWKVNEISNKIIVNTDVEIIIIGVEPVIISPLIKYGTVCCTINPERAREFIHWKLVSSTSTLSSVWLNSGQNVIIPYGSYSLQTTSICGWIVSKKDDLIIINSNINIILVGIKAELNGNLRVKLESKSIKDSARWRPINTSIWYMDNEEISLYPDTYEIEFKPVLNYMTPINQFYKVYENEVNIYTNTYYHLGSIQINIESLEDFNFGTPLWCIKNTNIWRRSGEILFLAAGVYTIEFNTVGNTFTHEDYTISIDNEISLIKEIEFVGVNLFVVPTKNNINFYNFNNLQKLNILTHLDSFTDANQVTTNYNDTLLAIAHNSSPFLTIYNLINYEIFFDKQLVKPTSGCRSLDFSDDGKYLAISYTNFPYLTLYNTSDWSQIEVLTPPTNYCNTVKFSHDSNYLVVGFDKAPFIQLYNTSTFEIINISTQIDKEVFICQFDPTNRYLGIGCHHAAYIYDINNNSVVLDIVGTIYGVEFFNNYLIIISSLYFYIYHYKKVLDNYVENKKILTSIPNINNYIILSPNQKYLVIGCVENPYVIIYETTNWTQVTFNNGLLNYCKKMVISKDLSLREYVNIPVNEYPIDKYRGLREFEPLLSSDFSCFSLTYTVSGDELISDTHIKSQWRVFNSDEDIVYDSDSCDDLTSHLIPESYFDTPTNYYWQVRHKGENFGWSFWSRMTTFSVVYSYIQKPINLTPEDESIDVIEHALLRSSYFYSVNATDTHIFSEWRIYDNTNTLKHTTGAILDFISYTIPEGKLVGESIYTWQVRHKGEILGWSDWSDKTSFTTGIWEISKPLNVYPYDKQLNIDETDLTLIASEFTVLNADDTHTYTRFEIYKNSNIVYSSGELIDVRENVGVSYIIPTEILNDGQIEYQWRIAYKGLQLGWSEWSNLTTFTTRVLQKSQIFITISPIMSTRLKWRWKEKSATDSTYSSYITPTYVITYTENNFEISTPYYIQIPSNQSIKINFEERAGLVSPSDIIIDNLLASEIYTYSVNYSMLYGDGQIQCNITDDLLNAGWRIVDTVSWRDSGYTETEIVYDVYDIEFKEVTGYIKPSNITGIIVKNSELIIKTATYTIDDSLVYYVVINIDRGQWKLNSGTSWYDSGTKVSLFGKSVVSIVFSDVDGYITPNDINFQIPNTYESDESVHHPTFQKTLLYTRSYSLDNIGQLKCYLSPGYAKWKLSTSSTLNNTVTILDLVAGNYTINFEKIDGYKNISDETAVVTSNTLTTVSKVYELEDILETGTGSFRVFLKPDGAGCRVVDSTEPAWYNSSAITTGIPVGTYVIEFKTIENYITPNNMNVVIKKDELTTINVEYEYDENQIKTIELDVQGVDYKITKIKYRVNFSYDDETYEGWTDWCEYYKNNLKNNLIKNPTLGYYQIEFNTIANYKPQDIIKTVDFNGVSMKVTFTYVGNNTTNYGKVNLIVSVIDNKYSSILNTNIESELEFQHIEISDSVYNTKDGKNINWPITWIKYSDVESIFTNLSTTTKHAYRIKSIDNYFNLGYTGNISYISFETNNTQSYQLSFIKYEFNEIYFGLPYFKNGTTGFTTPVMPNISDFNIEIRCKNEFEDTFSDKKTILINGDITNYTVDGSTFQLFKSNKYTLQTLFGCNQLGYISTKNFNVTQTGTTTTQLNYDPKTLIYFDGLSVSAILTPTLTTSTKNPTQYLSLHGDIGRAVGDNEGYAQMPGVIVKGYLQKFRVFIPPGTTQIYLNIYEYGQRTAFVRHKTIPTTFTIPLNYYSPQPKTLDELISSNQIISGREEGSISIINDSYATAIPVAKTGWLYVYVTASSSEHYNHSLMIGVNAETYNNWYDNINWTNDVENVS